MRIYRWLFSHVFYEMSKRGKSLETESDLAEAGSGDGSDFKWLWCFLVLWWGCLKMRLWCCAQFCVHWKLWTCPLDVCVLCYGGEFHLRVWFTNSFLFFLWRSRPSDPSSPSLWGLVFKRLPCTRPRFLHDEEGCFVLKDGKDFLIFLPCICWTLIPFWRNGVLSVLYQKRRWTPLSLPTVLEFIK